MEVSTASVRLKTISKIAANIDVLIFLNRMDLCMSHDVLRLYPSPHTLSGVYYIYLLRDCITSRKLREVQDRRVWLFVPDDVVQGGTF